MQKIVEVPGIGNVEFPDSMSDADIGAVLRKQHPGLMKPQTLTPELLSKRQGMIGCRVRRFGHGGRGG